MKCSEFHELAAAYALDALSEEERLACARHLHDEGPHEGCDELLARYERVVDALAAGIPRASLTPAVWRAIESRIARGDGGTSDKVVPIGVGATHKPGSRREATSEQQERERAKRWREGIAWAAAAATLLGALWSHQTAQQLVRNTARERTRAEESLASTNAQLASTQAARAECAAALQQLTQRIDLRRDAVALLEDPTTQIAPMAAAGTQPYKATALYNPKTQRALVISSSIKQVEGKDYELWVIAAGEAPRPAGFMRFDSTGVSIGEFDSALLRGTTPAALAVSLEPLGGRPTPTEVVLIAKLHG
jgi:anti-sigma-K factor RskA